MGQLMNTDNGATRIIVPIRKDIANSAQRTDVISEIVKYGTEFANATKIDVHYAGLIFVSATMTTTVRKELSLFLYLSAIITGA